MPHPSHFCLIETPDKSILSRLFYITKRHQSRLPKERYALYDKAVDTLISTWDASKDLSLDAILHPLEFSDIRRLMEQLAYWIHTQGNAQEGEGGTLIERDDLIDQLTQVIREQKRLERHVADQLANRFLDLIIRDRAGLISKQTPTQYAFVHKTFQEYLTAMEIYDRQADRFEVVLDLIRDHLHDPHWQEVLLLLIAQQRRTNPDRALNSILNHPDPYETLVHRNLLFAGKCLAENVLVSDSLVEQILQQLIALETSHSPLISRMIEQQVFDVLCGMSHTQYHNQTFGKLLENRNHIDPVRLLRYRVVFGEREAVLQELRLLATEGPAGEDTDYFFGALSVLDELDQETTAQALFKNLLDESGEIRIPVLGQLADQDQLSDEVIRICIEQMENDLALPFMVVSFMGAAKTISEASLQLLLDHFYHSRTERGIFLMLLTQFGKDSQKIKNTFLHQLASDDPVLQIEAIEALGKLGNAAHDVIGALEERIQDPNSGIRLKAALSLVRIEPLSTLGEQALLDFLDDEDPSSQVAALSTLVERNPYFEEAIPVLLQLLESPIHSIQVSAIEIAARLPVIPIEVIQNILILDSDVWNRAGWAFFECLGKMNQPPEQLFTPLLESLQSYSGQTHDVVGKALAVAARANPVGIPIIAQWIEQHQNDEEVSYAVDALWNAIS